MYNESSEMQSLNNLTTNCILMFSQLYCEFYPNSIQISPKQIAVSIWMNSPMKTKHVWFSLAN